LKCLTETTWKIATWKPKWRKSFTEYTNPCFWNVALCRQCRVANYRDSLKKGSRAALILFFVFALGVIPGVLAVANITAFGKIGKEPGFLLIGALSLLFALLSIVTYIINKTRLLTAKSLEEIPIKRRSQAFVNAGQAILERLETGQGGPVYGSFALPLLPEAPAKPGVDLMDVKQESQKRLVQDAAAA
jgi:nitrate reductase NapE component